MAFFPRASYNDASFTPLFRLLEDFDSYSNSKDTGSTRRSQALPTWQPKFDVRETADAYELHGELPGMSRDNVSIEFTEPQTITIRGKTERTYTSGTPPAGNIEGAAPQDAITDGSDGRRSPHRATVEDEDEAAAHESGVSTEVVAKKQKTSQDSKPADKAKYWLSERSIGEFSRTFSFPTRVSQDEVTAGLKDGILSVTVPKAKKHETRRITITY